MRAQAVTDSIMTRTRLLVATWDHSVYRSYEPVRMPIEEY